MRSLVDLVNVGEGIRAVKFKVAMDAMIFVPGSADIRDDVEEHLDSVMNELVSLGGEDASIDLDFSPQTPEVTFCVVVVATNPLGAANQASGLIRAAIHTAGGNTPDWPPPHDDAWAVTLTGVSSSRVEIDTETPEEELVGA